MKTTVKALKDLYVKLGGELSDTYSTIAGGASVGEYNRIPDIIEAVKEKASGGASLPEVTAADNGDVLTVVEGEWAKADAPSGGGTFVIKFTTTYDETTEDDIYICNKTLTEIAAEHQANGYDNMRVMYEYGGSSYSPIYCHYSVDVGQFEAVFADIITSENAMSVNTLTLATDTQTQEDTVTHNYNGYTLTPSE